MELTNDVYNSVNSYFSVLSHIGYKPYSEVSGLLVYTFIEELLSGPMSFFITEDDYKSIANSVECLCGTCMIPYPAYRESFNEEVNNILDEYRVTEGGILRSTEDSKLRVES